MINFAQKIIRNLPDSTRDIGKLGSIKFANGLLALVQSLIVVQIFGISREIEIYIAAMFSIGTIDRMFNVGSVNEILIPTYVRLKEESQDVAMTSFSLVNNWFFLLSFFAALVIWFSAPYFLHLILPGFNRQEIAEATSLFRTLALFIPLKIFNGMCSIPFRANKNYVVHERTGMVNKLILIAMLLTVSDTYGVKVLVFGTILGIIIRFLYILYLFQHHLREL